MKALLPFLKPYRAQCIVSPLFKLLEAVLELFVPLVMAAIIDNGVAGGDTGYVLRMGLLLCGLGVLGFACSSTAQYFAAKAATGFAARLRSALFGHIQGFTYAQLDALGAPTLVNRLTTDLNQVQTGVNMTLRLLLRSPFVVFGAMVMAFAVDARSALIFAALIPLLALVVWGVMRLTLPRHRQVQGQLDRVLLRVRENLTGVRVLRAFNRQEHEVRAFGNENGALCDMQRCVGRISALMNPLTYMLVNLALVALLYTGARQVDGGVLLTGSVVALVNYLSQILVELIKLANLILTITKALACATRIEAVLAEPTGEDGEQAAARVGAAGASAADSAQAAVSASSGNQPNGRVGARLPAAAPPDDQPVVRFSHVCARYSATGEEALTDISFEAYRGQQIGVIGGTGSGKSTLVNLIPRFYEASAGTVEVLGADVNAQPVQALRSRIGVVPQKAALFRGTIRDNLRWGKQDATDDELWRALETAQAAEIVRGKPDGLDELIEQNARNLSGGQRQRLTIARALVRQPDILILDDSASALDYLTDAALRKALAQLEPPATVFVVSQRASSVRHADKILVLDDGCLAGCGTHDELLADCAVYREIYGSQYPKEATPA